MRIVTGLAKYFAKLSIFTHSCIEKWKNLDGKKLLTKSRETGRHSRQLTDDFYVMRFIEFLGCKQNCVRMDFTKSTRFWPIGFASVFFCCGKSQMTSNHSNANSLKLLAHSVFSISRELWFFDQASVDVFVCFILLLFRWNKPFSSCWVLSQWRWLDDDRVASSYSNIDL